MQSPLQLTFQSHPATQQNQKSLLKKEPPPEKPKPEQAPEEGAPDEPMPEAADEPMPEQSPEEGVPTNTDGSVDF